jgi:hypothetical protein
MHGNFPPGLIDVLSFLINFLTYQRINYCGRPAALPSQPFNLSTAFVACGMTG